MSLRRNEINFEYYNWKFMLWKIKYYSKMHNYPHILMIYSNTDLYLLICLGWVKDIVLTHPFGRFGYSVTTKMGHEPISNRLHILLFFRVRSVSLYAIRNNIRGHYMPPAIFIHVFLLDISHSEDAPLFAEMISVVNEIF